MLFRSLPTGDAAAAAWPLVSRALDLALDRLDAMRRSEGDAMARDMRVTLGEIRSIAARIRDRVPAALEEHRTRLLERVGRVLEQRGVALAEADLAREIALLADRSDIAEELMLSPKTVSVYRARVLEKLGLSNNSELTVYAIRNGLVAS